MYFLRFRAFYQFLKLDSLIHQGVNAQCRGRKRICQIVGQVRNTSTDDKLISGELVISYRSFTEAHHYVSSSMPQQELNLRISSFHHY